jgi:hypothetical protein
MFWGQITKTWMQLVHKPANAQKSTGKTDAGRDRSASSTSSVGHVFEEASPEPYTPANDARSSEDSLHFSC